MAETKNMKLQINEEMVAHKKEVMRLHHECMAACQRGDTKTALELMKEMRGIHGCAVYDNWMAVKRMEMAVKFDESKGQATNAQKQQGGHGIPDKAWINLSLNDSFLSIIRELIHTCALELRKHTGIDDLMSSQGHNHNSMSQSSFVHASNSKASSVPNVNKWATIRTNEDGPDEMSLKDDLFNTPYVSNSSGNSSIYPSSSYGSSNFGSTDLSNSMFDPQQPPQKGGHYDDTDGLTDYINGMTGGEYDRVMDQYGGHDDYDYDGRMYGGHGDYYDKPMYGGHDNTKGTAPSKAKYGIMFYWLTHCPASEEAKPVWDQFKAVMQRVMPEVAIGDFNVDDNGTDVNNANRTAAKAAGIEKVPALVVIHDGKVVYSQSFNKGTVADIQEKIAKLTGKLDDLKKYLGR